jgi:DNA adenine methylase
MSYLRIIKYPGSKTTLLPDIDKVFKKSRTRTLIDVFGGSGTVSLNLRAKGVVYNDINPELCNLFLAIKEDPEYMISRLADLLSNARYDPAVGKSLDRKRNSGREKNVALKQIIDSILINDEKHMQDLNKTDIPDLGHAFSTLCRFSASFGGMGKTYGTETEKAIFSYMRKTLHDFRQMSISISGWAIENLDFRDLVKKHDSPTAFFYFDPPYPGKDWYDNDFGLNDYEDMAELFESLRGKYLMNLDWKHKNLESVFGKPAFVKKYYNMNGGQNSKNPVRFKSFYTNVILQNTQVE